MPRSIDDMNDVQLLRELSELKKGFYADTVLREAIRRILLKLIVIETKAKESLKNE